MCISPFSLNNVTKAIRPSLLIDFHQFTHFDILKNALPISLPFLAHIIDQNEHLKIFENHFYKYILKIALSQKSKIKTNFLCLSTLSWTINLLIQLSFLKNYFANIPDDLS